MTKREQYEGNFLESSDLQAADPYTLEISEVIAPNTVKDARKKTIDRAILVFANAQKRLILGKTNERIIKAMYGAKAQQWVGKTVTLGVRYLARAFGEKNVPTIRVKPPDDFPIPFSARQHYGKSTPWTKSQLEALENK